MEDIVYQDKSGEVTWIGYQTSDRAVFDEFLEGPVKERLQDAQFAQEFRKHLAGLTSTGFDQANLQSFLDMESAEDREWAVGESIAEAWLESVHDVKFPWNQERDKKTPNASLPGADIVGFKDFGNGYVFVFGEIKTSSDKTAPPNVMEGSTGMKAQLEKLYTDDSILMSLVKWIYARVKGTSLEGAFNQAMRKLIQAPKTYSLIGVLVRDVPPNILDLQSKGRALGSLLKQPSQCGLSALYLPDSLSKISAQVTGGD